MCRTTFSVSLVLIVALVAGCPILPEPPNPQPAKCEIPRRPTVDAFPVSDTVVGVPMDQYGEIMKHVVEVEHCALEQGAVRVEDTGVKY